MILALDVATRTGWAYKAEIWHTGTVDATCEDTRRLTLLNAQRAGCTHLVVEDCFAGLNVGTFRTLIELQTKWKMDAAYMGYQLCKPVMPSVWQSKILVIGGCKPGKGETKQYAAIAARMLGANCKTQDECDAVCLCEYARCVDLDIVV